MQQHVAGFFEPYPCLSATAMTDPAQARNRRTALILLSIAAVFFVGIVVRRWWMGV